MEPTGSKDCGESTSATNKIQPASPSHANVSIDQKEKLENEWKNIVQTWYPEIDRKTYCVPPCIFKRVLYDEKELGGQTVLEAVAFKHAKSTQQPQPNPAQRPTPKEPPQRSPHEPIQPSHTTTSERTSEDSSSEMSLEVQGNAPENSHALVQERNQQIKEGSAIAPRVEKQRPSSHEAIQQTLLCSAEPPFEDLSLKPVACGPLTADSSTPLAEDLSAVSQREVQPKQQQQALSPRSMWNESSTGHYGKYQESDTRDDLAKQRILHCLQEMGEKRKEAMFVVTSLEFEDYLKNTDKADLFPLPGKLSATSREGDFDVIVIHRKHGILLGEIKSIGLYDEPEEKTVCKRIYQALAQLKKCKTAMKHMVSDIAQDLAVHKTVILPYISRDCLSNVFKNNKPLKQAVWKCCGTSKVKTAVDLTVCRENVSDPAALSDWWEKRMGSAVDRKMTSDVYLGIAARIVGPATTVKVHCVCRPRVCLPQLRTAGDVVSELGWRLALLVLTPEQVALLTEAPELICLTGPPGTGKSLVLVIKGLIWAREGHVVIVLSTRPASLAASRLIHHQLQMTLRAADTTARQSDQKQPASPGTASGGEPASTSLEAATSATIRKPDLTSTTEPSDPTAEEASTKLQTPGEVRFMHYDLYNQPQLLETALKNLVSNVDEKGRLFVLMDEANFRGRNVGEASRTLVHELKARVKHLSLWAARILNNDIPDELQEVTLTVPLRSAPVVIREIQPSISMYTDVCDYSGSGTVSPCDGPKVEKLRHQGEGHAGDWPVDCVQCGHEIAKLLNKLGVGKTDTSNPCGPPGPLQYRDVFVLTRSSQLREKTPEQDASGVVRGLRAENIPVGVVGWMSKDDADSWEKSVHDVSVAETDQVTVAAWGAVHGLERKIVVCLPGRWGVGVDDDETDEDLEAHDKLHLASRCTTQLVLVEMSSERRNPSKMQETMKETC